MKVLWDQMLEVRDRTTFRLQRYSCWHLPSLAGSGLGLGMERSPVRPPRGLVGVWQGSNGTGLMLHGVSHVSPSAWPHTRNQPARTPTGAPTHSSPTPRCHRTNWGPAIRASGPTFSRRSWLSPRPLPSFSPPQPHLSLEAPPAALPTFWGPDTLSAWTTQPAPSHRGCPFFQAEPGRPPPMPSASASRTEGVVRGGQRNWPALQTPTGHTWCPKQREEHRLLATDHLRWLP